MNFARRRKLRETRRARRQAALTVDQAGDGVSGQPPTFVSQGSGAVSSGAVDGATATPVAATASAASLPGRPRRAALGDAARLAEKIRRRKEARTRADRALSAREAMVQQRYAPYVGRLLRPEDTTTTTAAPARAPAQPHPGPGGETGVTDFDKEGVLATLITEARANFMNIDRALSEDHTIATRHLHSAVFSHANNFLLLFRDVDRASGLVETLKSSVQGTKTAISSISKFTYANVAHLGSSGAATGLVMTPSGAERDGVAAGRRYMGQSSSDGGTAVFGFTAMNGDASRPRLSLITRRLYTSREGRGPARGAAPSSCPGPSRPHSSAPHPDQSPGFTVSRAARTSRDDHAAGLTTRGLNVASVRQWRYGMGLRQYSVLPYALRRQNLPARAIAATSVEAEATAMQRFVDVLREEVNQLLAERKPLQAAELLHGVAADATAKGCLPTLLELEAMVVYAVVESLHHVPMTPMYAESVHVPLLQLLLRFGRERSAAAAYLSLQAPWLHRELRKLQTRVSPAHAGTVAVDFLVRAMRFMLYRQHTLWLTLPDAEERARRQALSHRDDLYAPDMLLPSAELTATPAQPPTPSTRSALQPVVAGASNEVAARASELGLTAPPLIPPNSGALLWVRRNVAEFTQTVLATHMLSYGTGTDGGDPSRIRRAATLMAETLRLLRTMTQDGFAGCDTSTLRQLTPTLMLLESDFAQLTARRLRSSGRAMLEQLVSSVRYMYETHGAAYDATVCADVARQGNAQCQQLLRQTVQSLPDGAYTWLLQLLLAPASARRTPRGVAAGPDTPGSRSPAPAATASVTATASPPPGATVAHAFVSPTLYRFFRYANGGSPLVGLLLRSMTGFVAAMAGSERLPAELMAHGSGNVTRAGEGTPPPVARPGRAGTTSQSRGAGDRSRLGAGEGRDGDDPRTHDDTQAALRSRVECATLLLGNALVTESVDVTLHRLVQTFVQHTRAQRAALVRFVSSDIFLGPHRQAFGSSNAAVGASRAQRPPGTTTRPPLLADAVRSPCWVLDSLIPLLTDVLTVAVWVSYLAGGGALGQMLANPAIEFRTQYVESWRRVMPTWVQDWLTTTLVLGFDVTAGAGALLRGPASRRGRDKAAAAVRRGVVAPPSSLSRPSLSAASSFTGPAASWLGDKESGCPGGALARLPSVDVDGTGALRDGNEPPGWPATRDAGAAVSRTGPQADRRRIGSGFTVVAVHLPAATVEPPVTVSISDNAKEGALGGHEVDSHDEGGPNDTIVGIDNDDEDERAEPDDGPLVDYAAREVNVRALGSFLAAVLERAYTTPRWYKVHHYLTEGPDASAATAVAGGATATTTAFAVRAVIGRYPRFPIGRRFDRQDELFLFHWVAQIALHLLTLLQERLLTPSFVVNGRAADEAASSSMTKARLSAMSSTTGLTGCTSPREDSVFALLSAGGGGYVAAIGLLQFAVLRLLRDALCQPTTWCAVYRCGVQEWRASAEVLRQQLFFFALYMHFWAPLFDSCNVDLPPLSHGEAAENADAGEVSAMSLLQWLTCSTANDPRQACDAADGKESESRDETCKQPLREAGYVAHDTPSRPASVTATRNRTSKYPVALQQVVQFFFENTLGEARAMQALGSDLMYNRVVRACNNINLLDFVDATLDSSDETDDSSSSDDDDEEQEKQEQKANDDMQTSPEKTGITLQRLQTVLQHYLHPITD